jgi:hypothetical protein
MRVLFATEVRVDAGSIQAVASYIRAGGEAGHELALWGKDDPRFPGVRFSLDAASFDQMVFISESNVHWLSGVRRARVAGRMPRARRAVVDADGMYNERIVVDDYDRTHWDAWDREQWLRQLDGLAGRIFQPTRRPLDPKVRPLSFYGHSEAAEIARDRAPEKLLDVLLVGHNWWRWRDVSSLILPALERLQGRLRGARFMGRWWDGLEPWAAHKEALIACAADKSALMRAGVEVHGPVAFSDVISVMSTARINLMTQRPLFRHLRLLTSKFFEILCADTIPLVLIDPDHAEEIYGSAGRELVLGSSPQELADKIVHALEHPAHYRDVVDTVRGHVRYHHGYAQRVHDLVAALEDC